jgi:hypothetical protein
LSQTIYTISFYDIWMSDIGEEEEFAVCIECGNSIEKCICVCPYCGERDKCECVLSDSSTGG